MEEKKIEGQKDREIQIEGYMERKRFKDEKIDKYKDRIKISIRKIILIAIILSLIMKIHKFLYHKLDFKIFLFPYYYDLLFTAKSHFISFQTIINNVSSSVSH